MFDNVKVDVYSYGVLLWEMETGSIPFDTVDEKTMKYMLLE